MNANVIQPRDRLGFTLFLAASLHAALILGIGFSSDLNMAESESIEVTLALTSDALAPENAVFIAATNQLGSGDDKQINEPTTTERAEFHSNTAEDILKQTQAAVPEQTEDQREVLSTTGQTDELVATNDETPLPNELTLSEQNTYEQLLEEIASLEARIAQEEQAQAQEPRVKRLTSVSAKSAHEAAYLNMWREKVERVGNANFPSDGVFGKLRMLVVLEANGQLAQVRILDPSGYQSLDSAAMRIVRLAAPFQPFPVDMRKQYDRLEIIRTWKFSRTGTALGS